MGRLHLVDPQNASDVAQAIFRKNVWLPNILCILANSDAVLEAFSSVTAEIQKFNLSPKHRKMISLAVSQFNRCPYCIALHTHHAETSGLLTRQECLDARRMASPDHKANAMLKLTQGVLETQGHVEDDLITAVRQCGFGDPEIVEAVATIAFVTMANFTANVARVEMDFPQPPSLV